MAKPVILDTLSKISNNAMDTGYVSKCFRKGRCQPSIQKADQLSKETYRPVSILPSLSKVYEKVPAIQLREYFKKYF